MEELKDLREKIDAIDQQMVDLFKQRMEVSKEVAAYKQANGLPTLDAGRERALLGKVGEQAGGGAGRLHPVGVPHHPGRRTLLPERLLRCDLQGV